MQTATKLDFKQRIQEMTEEFSKTKLKVVFDFVQYLRDKEEAETFLKMQKTQMKSKSYQEWASVKNDIYDKLFKDEI